MMWKNRDATMCGLYVLAILAGLNEARLPGCFWLGMSQAALCGFYLPVRFAEAVRQSRLPQLPPWCFRTEAETPVLHLNCETVERRDRIMRELGWKP